MGMGWNSNCLFYEAQTNRQTPVITPLPSSSQAVDIVISTHTWLQYYQPVTLFRLPIPKLNRHAHPQQQTLDGNERFGFNLHVLAVGASGCILAFPTRIRLIHTCCRIPNVRGSKVSNRTWDEDCPLIQKCLLIFYD